MGNTVSAFLLTINPMGKLGDKFKNTLGNVVDKGKDAAARAKEAAERAAAEARKKATEAARKAEEARNKALNEAKKKQDAINNKINESLNKIKSKLLPKDAPYIALLPFKPVMQAALKQRNIANNGSLSDVSKKFYGGVVIPSYKKAPVVNVLSGKSLIKHSFDADGDTSYTEEGSTAAQYEEGAKETMNMIQKIVAWFKERKAKKEAKKAAEAEAAAAGQMPPANYGDLSTPPLTPEEEVMVDKVDETTKEIVEAAEKDATNEEGFSTFEIFMGIAGIVVAGLVIKKLFF